MTALKPPTNPVCLSALVLLACALAACTDNGSSNDALQTRQIRKLNELARDGDKDARFILGYFYFTGEGILRDLETGRTVIGSGVEERHATARRFADTFKTYLDHHNEIPADKLVRWVRENAELGDGCTQYIEGTWFAFGNGVPLDPVTARRWLRSARGNRVAIAGWLLDELAAESRQTPR